jgi:N-terminal domain of cytochrome oxidase-cbb3, FixP
VPTKIEKDAVSGRDTTGHEWDGIKELDTPLPKWWLYTQGSPPIQIAPNTFLNRG